MIKDYHEHTLGARSDSRSVAYIRCVFPQGESYWGVGIDNDVARASLQALCNALSAADQAGDENSRWGDAHHPTKHGAEGAVATVAQLQRHPQHRWPCAGRTSASISFARRTHSLHVRLVCC